MSSLQQSIAQVSNRGIPSGPIVSGEEHTVTGSTTMMLTVTLGAGSGTIEFDNGGGFTTPEPLVDRASLYDLKQCKFKIILAGGATASAS